MNKYAALSILALFIFIGGAISYNEITREADTGAVALTENRSYAVSKEIEEVRVQKYYYAAETYDKVLVPLAFVSEIITAEDEAQFALITNTILPQIEYEEIEKGVEMIMIHVNRNRQYPVWVEVIRVTE